MLLRFFFLNKTAGSFSKYRSSHIREKNCGRLVVALTSSTYEYAPPRFSCPSYSPFVLFRLAGGSFYLRRSSFHREQSWLIAGAIIVLKTTRHIGTESRKYAKLVRSRGEKKKSVRVVCFSDSDGLVTRCTCRGPSLLIIHDAFNFDGEATAPRDTAGFDRNSWRINNWVVYGR